MADELTTVFNNQKKVLDRLKQRGDADLDEVIQVIEANTIITEALIEDFGMLGNAVNDVQHGLFAQAATAQAIFNLLVSKGLITVDEVVTERSIVLNQMKEAYKKQKEEAESAQEETIPSDK